MVKFFETLKDFVSYDEEVFQCELVVSNNRSDYPVIILVRNMRISTVFTFQQQGWSLSVELVIGGRGIRQRTQKNSAVRMRKI